jgi:uncharacterized protein (DUF2141 family)
MTSATLGLPFFTLSALDLGLPIQPFGVSSDLRRRSDRDSMSKGVVRNRG